MILITGASKGIGKFLMQKYLEIGEKVQGTYNSSIPDELHKEFYSKIDITSYSEVSEWINRVCETNENLVLLNCAGGNYNAISHKADIKKWVELININLIGTFNVIKAVLPIMRERGFGRIINFASIVAQKGIPGTSAYAASKSGLWGMTRSIAVENAKKGITINNLNLGYFDIGMITEVPEEMLTFIKKEIPTGELGNPENIFNAVNFLIKSDYINGTSIDISAGLY